MKNRKRIIASFMIIACMLMAVGFAALTDTLNINGEAEVDFTSATSGFDADVYFSDAQAANNNDTANVTVASNDVAMFSVRSLTAKGETATFTFTIQNDNEFAAYVKLNEAKNVNNNTEYFSVDLVEKSFEVPAHGTATVTVTVELLKTPQLDAAGDKITASFGYELDVQDEAFQ